MPSTTLLEIPPAEQLAWQPLRSSLPALSCAPVSHCGSPAAYSRGLLPITSRQACPVAPARLRPRLAASRAPCQPPGAGLGRRPGASPTQRVYSRRDCGKIAFEIPIRIRIRVYYSCKRFTIQGGVCNPMAWLTDPQTWVAFLTLTALELVLGVDNVIFISILAGKLPHAQQQRARTLGLGLAMLMRIALLFSLSWIIRLTAPLFTVLGQEISGRDLILLVGGLFLIGKSTHEIHVKLEGEEGHASARVKPSFMGVLIQILLLDIVFSLDSVITAVGMTDRLGVMIAAVVVAVVCMMVFAGPISHFVERHPTVKMLALSFLLLIGVTLIAEGLDRHIPKGYIYFAMAFSVFVEMLNLQLRRPRTAPVKLHEPYARETGGA
jgi:predicted tellurium resistance membrane protein TerC